MRFVHCGCAFTTGVSTFLTVIKEPAAAGWRGLVDWRAQHIVDGVRKRPQLPHRRQLEEAVDVRFRSHDLVQQLPIVCRNVDRLGRDEGRSDDGQREVVVIIHCQDPILNI